PGRNTTPMTGSAGAGPARRRRDAGPCSTPARQPPSSGSTRCARPAGSTDSAASVPGHHHTALTHDLSSGRPGRRNTTRTIYAYPANARQYAQRVQTDLLTSVLDLTGVFANGLLGGAVARSQGLDPVRFGALGLVCGLGGGVIRDVLLQHGTPAALTHPAYIATALAGAGVAFVIRIEHRAWDRVFLLVDAAAI